LDQYSDAELLRKKVAAMFAGFIIKPAAEGDVIPLDNSAQTQGPPQTSPDPGTANAKLEPGTLQELLPNEDVRFPTVPDSPDFERFINVQLHQFAAGCGLTYEQVTGDLRGVNYSSIRAGLLEFRRKVEQFQHNVIVFQACRPVFRRWLKEAVLCGALDLPGYFDDPRPYESVIWVTPGWPWVDPLKDVQASIQGIRAGLSTRSLEVSSRGYDSAAIDAEQASDGARADRLKLIYDSDPRHVLVGRETNPTTPAKPLESGTPEEEEAQEQLDR
jgi:lambda family phage portal protein